MDKEYDVIVIGAGPAGMLAAGFASENGAKTLIIEKMREPGRKLKMTGKGRCNITNDSTVSNHFNSIRVNARFLKTAYKQFFTDELREFLSHIGVSTCVERGDRVFPVSQRAEDVVGSLSSWMVKSGVIMETGWQVKEIITEENRIVGVSVLPWDAKKTASIIRINAKKVIVATGGISYPATGSTGDGYLFAKKCGHTIVSCFPALVPIETEGNTAQLLKGLSLKNVTVSVWVNGRKKVKEFGEMLFTHFGLSGPVILTLSREILISLRKKEKVTLTIDLKPALDEKKLDNRLLREIEKNKKKQFNSLLKSLLPAKMVSVCSNQIHIDEDKPACHITSDERKRLRMWLKELSFSVSGYRSFKEAIITAGGVDVREVKAGTMESKSINGLYFAGEVLDLDADTGGYNLQIAFSTGRLAGLSASYSLS